MSSYTLEIDDLIIIIFFFEVIIIYEDMRKVNEKGGWILQGSRKYTVQYSFLTKLYFYSIIL